MSASGEFGTARTIRRSPKFLVGAIRWTMIASKIHWAGRLVYDLDFTRTYVRLRCESWTAPASHSPTSTTPDLLGRLISPL